MPEQDLSFFYCDVDGDWFAENSKAMDQNAKGALDVNANLGLEKVETILYRVVLA